MAITITPYLSVVEAQEYFDSRLNTEAWDDASDEDKLKSLKMATSLINNLNFIGFRLTNIQENEFPRLGQTIVPQDILIAVCELAIQLLDEIDINLEIKNIGVNRRSFSMTSTGYDDQFVLPHIRAGIISAEAWMKLLPYLKDPLAISFSSNRANINC